MATFRGGGKEAPPIHHGIISCQAFVNVSKSSKRETDRGCCPFLQGVPKHANVCGRQHPTTRTTRSCAGKNKGLLERTCCWLHSWTPMYHKPACLLTDQLRAKPWNNLESPSSPGCFNLHVLRAAAYRRSPQASQIYVSPSPPPSRHTTRMAWPPTQLQTPCSCAQHLQPVIPAR